MNQVVGRLASLGILFPLAHLSAPALAQVHIDGRVKVGNSTIAGSEVTLRCAGPGAPEKLAQIKAGSDGHFAHKDKPEDALSTRFKGDGTVVLFGLAAPVRTPLSGPVRAQQSRRCL